MESDLSRVHKNKVISFIASIFPAETIADGDKQNFSILLIRTKCIGMDFINKNKKPEVFHLHLDLLRDMWEIRYEIKQVAKRLIKKLRSFQNSGWRSRSFLYYNFKAKPNGRLLS